MRYFSMRLALLVICSLFALNSFAQEFEGFTGEDNFEDEFDNPDNQQDSIIVVDNSEDPSGFKAIFSGKPGKAALKSLMIPGWGQVYNGKAWKLPLVYGLEGGVIYYLIRNISRYKDFDACYRSIVTDNMSIPECRGISSVGDAFLVRQNYRKQRELSYVFVALAHLFQGFEAFIDRHLVDFDLDEDLSLSPFLQPLYDTHDINIVGIYFNLSPNKKLTTPAFNY